MMSLRTTYSGAIDAKLAAARTAGYESIVTDSLATITSAMTAAANSGKRSFTVNIGASFQPADLRLKGSLWFAYQTGVFAGLAAQDIMNDEVAVNLNTADQMATSIDLVFNF